MLQTRSIWVLMFRKKPFSVSCTNQRPVFAEHSQLEASITWTGLSPTIRLVTCAPGMASCEQYLVSAHSLR